MNTTKEDEINIIDKRIIHKAKPKGRRRDKRANNKGIRKPNGKEIPTETRPKSTRIGQTTSLGESQLVRVSDRMMFECLSTLPVRLIIRSKQLPQQTKHNKRKNQTRHT